jgi:hypothetical protein
MNPSLDELKKQDVEACIQNLDQSLRTRHHSMVEGLNPVLVALKEGRMGRAQAEAVLQQYSWLPFSIVHFLSTGRDRMSTWPNTKTELQRNINEETGSRTGGMSHYEILKTGFQEELRLNLNNLTTTDATQHFLDLVDGGLASKPAPFVAGIVYALEASAVPELTVVAHIVNYCAKLKDLEAPISWVRVDQFPASAFINLSLNTFFIMHLHDFEVGHKNGLVLALTKDMNLLGDLDQFAQGFNYLLNAMDAWWAGLASTTS